jgi:hypothetical protein
VPLTLSHPAAVLPLRRIGLPLSAMVAGSMVPDVPLYLGSRHGYDVAHSPLGVPTVDVVAALVALAVWFAVLRDPLADLSPDAVRSRVAPRARLTRRQWLLAPLGALVGAVSHVVWDSFTHADLWGYDHVAWLRTDHVGIAGLRWSQYGSALIGLAAIGLVVALDLRACPTRPRRARVLSRAALPAVIASMALAGAVAAGLHLTDGLYVTMFHGALTAVIVLVLGIAAVCGLWHLVARRHDR